MMALPVDEGVDGKGVVFAGGEKDGVEEGIEELDGEDGPIGTKGGAEN